MVAGASEFAVVIAVPVALGKVIVLSAVGSTTVRVVSYASSVAPSKTILLLAAVIRVSNVTAETSPLRVLNSVINSSRVFSSDNSLAVTVAILVLFH